MNVLALDLGTNTGFALGAFRGILAGYPMSCGTWELGTKEQNRQAKHLRLDRRLDPRAMELWKRIDSIHSHFQLDWLVWEDVQFSSFTNQTQLWASFRTVCWVYAGLHNIKTECCPVATLKKFATGSGAADKSAMAKALLRDRRFVVSPKNRVVDTLTGATLDDNAVDALQLLRWANYIIQ